MTSPDEPTPFWRANSALERIAPAIILAILVLIGYLPALQASFLSDDYIFLAFAQYGPSDWSIMAVNPDPWLPFYRPLGLVAWKGLFLLFGNQPFGYHLFNVSLHWLNCNLVVILTRMVAPRSKFVAISAGILFALLPSQVEPVVWLSAMFDLLATFGYLTTLICALAAWRTRRPALFLFAIGAYQLCIWSKEIAFTLPVMLLLLGLADPKRFAAKQVIGGCLILSALVGANLIQRYLAWGSVGGYTQVSYDIGGFVSDRMASALELMIAPLHQQFFSAYLRQAMLIAMSAVMIIGLIFITDRRTLLLAIGWLFVTLLPVVNVLPVLPDLQQSRYLYLPSVGFCFGLATLIHDLAERFSSRLRRAAMLGSLAILAASYTLILQIHQQPWLVASRAADNIADYIHRLVPNNRPGSLLHVTSLPDNYAGAYIYRLGIDPALLTRYGQLFNFWPDTNIMPIPYERLHITGDFYEVEVIYNQRTHGWDTISARAVTTPSPQPYLAPSHWLFKMGAGPKLAALRDAWAPAPSLGDRSWDFIECRSALEWTLHDTQAACTPGQGWEARSQGAHIAIESPVFQISHHGWVEVIVTLQTSDSPTAEASLVLAWKNDRTEQRYRRRLAINMPRDTAEQSYHFFIRLDRQPLEQIRLDLAGVPGTVLIRRVVVHPVP